MFKRRIKRSNWATMRELLWPRMGWPRTITYYWHRLQRIPGTPASIAAGFACGAAASMTPFYGTHMVTAGILAWSLRSSIVAAMVGAQIANPWTAPPLWFAAYYIGAVMLGIDVGTHPPNFVHMFKGLTESFLNVDMALFVDSVWPVFWPMIVGSVPMAFAAGLISYFMLEPVLKAVHHRRAERLRRRVIADHAGVPPAGADV